MDQERQLITKRDFLNYFNKPYVFGFLCRKKAEDFFLDEILLEQLEEIKTQDLYALLREVDSKENLFLENFRKLNRLKNKNLLDFYARKFKLPTLSIYDFSESREDNTKRVLNLLKEQDDVFLFFPSLIFEDLKISPTVIYKSEGKIYLIEHLWSFSLKREILGVFVYYHHVLNLLNLRVDQYFVSYLSKEEQIDKELLVSISPSIPFKSKQHVPDEGADKKLRNINSYFGLNMSYQKTLYKKLCSESDFYSINNDSGEEDFFIDPKSVIDELRKFIESPNRNIDFLKISNSFLSNRGRLVSPESEGFKFIFRNCFSNFEFSNSLIQFHKVLMKLLSFKEEEERDYFFRFVSDLEFLDFPKDQDYIVFKGAVNAFEELKEISTKVYYDFETVSFPFPYIEKIKPYTQIVLQLSLIKTVNGKEVKVVNEILDPLTLKIEDFKKIIDSIYVDEPNVAYIVYNKAFENTRLKEMAGFINQEEYTQKILEIIDRTIDLVDGFRYGNNPFLIHKKLQGFHSIKKVTKLISKDIEKRAGAVQYSDLKRCQNGIMAQALLVSRALSDGTKEDDKNGEKNKDFMVSYCENDVRSMIAVELLIEELIRNNKYDFYDLEEYMKSKTEFKRRT